LLVSGILPYRRKTRLGIGVKRGGQGGRGEKEKEKENGTDSGQHVSMRERSPVCDFGTINAHSRQEEVKRQVKGK